MKKKLFISAIIIGIIIVIFAVIFFIATDGLKEGLSVHIDSIDLSKVEDGVYTGTYEHKRWTNTVKVYVQNHAITKIEIMNDVAGADITGCSGEIINRVIKSQNTNIDAVAGATVTSKAYLKAIENALSD